MRWVVLLALITGCDKLFGLIPVDETSGGDAATSDGVADVASEPDASVDASSVDLGCPNSYTINLSTSISQTRYRYVQQAVDWAVAQQDCAGDKLSPSLKHTHLAVLSNDQERSAMYFTIAGSAGAVWIGLSDRISEGQFRWVTNENTGGYPPSEAWTGGEPGGEGNCVAVLPSTTNLDDVDCITGGNAAVVGYVCECDVFLNQPTNY